MVFNSFFSFTNIDICPKRNFLGLHCKCVAKNTTSSALCHQDDCFSCHFYVAMHYIMSQKVLVKYLKVCDWIVRKSKKFKGYSEYLWGTLSTFYECFTLKNWSAKLCGNVLMKASKYKVLLNFISKCQSQYNVFAAVGKFSTTSYFSVKF